MADTELDILTDLGTTSPAPDVRGDPALLAKLENDTNKRAQIQQAFVDDKEARRPYDAQWLDNINMFGGNQWVSYDYPSRRWLHAKMPAPNFVFLEDNKLINDVDIITSRITADFPIPHCTPFGLVDATGNNQHRSKRWTTLFADLWPRIRDEQFVRMLAYNLAVFGTVFRSMDYDATAGHKVLREKTGPIPVMVNRAFCRNCEEPYPLDDTLSALPDSALQCPRCNLKQSRRIAPVPDEIDGPTGEYTYVPQGEVVMNLFACYEFYKPAGAPTLDRCGHLFRHRYMDTAWIKSVTGKDILPDPSIRAEDNWEVMIQDITGTNPIRSMQAQYSQNRVLRHSAEFTEYWERPGSDPDYKYGLYVMLGGQELQPLLAKRYNTACTLPFGLQMDVWEYVPNRFWGRSYVEKMLPLQRWINSLISLRAYQRRRLSHRLVLNKKNSGLTTEHLTGPALVADLKRDDLTKDFPRVLDLGGADQTLNQEIQDAFYIWDDTSGLQQILRGQAPTNQRTATGQNELREQAEAPIIAKVKCLYASEIPLAREAERLIRKYYDPERDIIISQVGNFEVSGFKAKELGLDMEDQLFDSDVSINIDLDAASSLTLYEKLQRTLTFNQTFPGFLNMLDPQVSATILNLWRLPPQLYSPANQIQKERAEREMRKALAGDLSELMVAHLDEDVTHLAIHMRFLLSEEGMELRTQHPDVYTAIEQHWFQHWQRQSARQQAMQARPPQNGNGQ